MRNGWSRRAGFVVALALVAILALPAAAQAATLVVGVRPGAPGSSWYASNVFPRLVELYGKNYYDKRMLYGTEARTYSATFYNVPRAPVRARVRWIGTSMDRSYYGNPWPYWWSSDTQTVYVSPGVNN